MNKICLKVQQTHTTHYRNTERRKERVREGDKRERATPTALHIKWNEKKVTLCVVLNFLSLFFNWNQTVLRTVCSVSMEGVCASHYGERDKVTNISQLYFVVCFHFILFVLLCAYCVRETERSYAYIRIEWATEREPSIKRTERSRRKW